MSITKNSACLASNVDGTLFGNVVMNHLISTQSIFTHHHRTQHAMHQSISFIKNITPIDQKGHRDNAHDVPSSKTSTPPLSMTSKNRQPPPLVCHSSAIQVCTTSLDVLPCTCTCTCICIARSVVHHHPSYFWKTTTC